MGGGNNYGNRLDNRQRGNASQLLEKYRALARDAQQAGDRVTAEYYLQYADLYYRVLGDYRDKAPDQNRARRDNYDDDSAGFNGSDDIDSDEDDDGDDRGEVRADDAPRNDSARDDRGWREDRPAGNRDRNPRDGNRDQPRREAESGRDGNRDANRDANREGGQREFRREGGNRDREGGNRDREGGNRDRQGWSNDRNRDRNDRVADAPRNGDASSAGDAPRAMERASERNGERRPERRPESPRPVAAESIDEGPIPGLPGPATLRLSRKDTAQAAPRAERAPRAEAASPEAAPLAVAAEAEAPKRRGRPRKVVDEAIIEG
jgi:hypothetical protein